MEFVLQLVDNGFERLVIFVRPFLNTHHDITVHLDETPITIPGEPFVFGGGRQRDNALVVQAEV